MMDIGADLQQAFDEGYERAKEIYQKAFEDIRKEIQDATKCIYGKCIGSKCPSDTDCMIMGEHAIEIIDRHNPANVESEG